VVDTGQPSLKATFGAKRRLFMVGHPQELFAFINEGKGGRSYLFEGFGL
jgi:hypothetical protein